MENPLDPGYWLSDDLRSFGFKAVGENVRISKACNVVGPENIEIGDNVRIDAFTSLIANNGSLRLGSFIHIGSNCTVGARGGVVFGDFSGLSHGVRVFTASDDMSGQWMTSCEVAGELTNPKIAPVIFGAHTAVGSNAVVLPGVTFADGAVLGTSSLAHRSLSGWAVHFGSPAKIISKRSQRVIELEASARGLLSAA